MKYCFNTLFLLSVAAMCFLPCVVSCLARAAATLAGYRAVNSQYNALKSRIRYLHSRYAICKLTFEFGENYNLTIKRQ